MKYTYLSILIIILFASCEKNSETNDEVTEITPPTSLDGISVEILQPTHQESVIPDQELYFEGFVRAGSSTDLTRLKANWISDQDGLIYEGNISQDGEISFNTSELTKNIHQIKLNIINEVDSVISDSIEIYNAIKLLPIEKTNNSSTITWCSLNDADFQSFELYRSMSKNNMLQEDPIFVTNNIQDTVFLDTTAIIGEKHFYKVVLNRSSQSPDSFESNIDSVNTGNFIKTDFPILKLVPDMTRNYAYGIANTSSIYDNNENGYGLVFINLNDFAVEKRILQDVRFSDLDIDPTGNYLYAASRSNIVFKVNLNTQELESSIILSHSAHKLEIGNNGKLYYHLTPPTSGSTEFRIYDLDNDLNLPYSTDIPAAYSSFRHGDFEIDQNNVIYHGGSNSSNSDLSKIGTTNDIFSLIDQWDSNNYQSARIVLNNNKLYWNQYVLDLNLNILGTFQNEYGNTDIQDVSPDGNYALGWSNIFYSNDQSILKEIPVFFDTGIFISDTELLIYKNDNPIYNQFESTIYLYEFTE